MIHLVYFAETLASFLFVAVVLVGRFQAPASSNSFTFTSQDVRIKDGTLTTSPTSPSDGAMETSAKQAGQSAPGMWTEQVHWYYEYKITVFCILIVGKEYAYMLFQTRVVSR